MRVQVKLYASLRRFRPELKLGEAFECELAAGATVNDLIANTLQLPEGEVAIVLVNGVYQLREYELRAGDVVALWPPVAGG